jgi:hypothetical protein
MLKPAEYLIYNVSNGDNIYVNSTKHLILGMLNTYNASFFPGRGHSIAKRIVIEEANRAVTTSSSSEVSNYSYSENYVGYSDVTDNEFDISAI